MSNRRFILIKNYHIHIISDFIGLLFILTIHLSQSVYAGNVKDFGAVGDGIHDDTKAIMEAVTHCDDGLVVFPKGQYMITQTIDIDLSQKGRIGLLGKGGSATIIMKGKGAAFMIKGSHDGTSDPSSIREQVWKNERMPVIQDIEIVGEHPDASGFEISNTLQIVFRSVLVRNVKYGLHFTSRSRNVLIESCHIFDCSEVGIYLDQVNIHQMNITNSHISYNDRSGIKVLGGQIRNFQITGNDIEYNFALDGKQSADIWIDNTMEGSSVREGSITGNTIQAKVSESGCNILFEGSKNTANKVGLWSITGNHISHQAFNIRLNSARGVSISGNTIIRGDDRHIVIENSENISLGSNVFDRNADYHDESINDRGGILIVNSKNITCDNQILDGIENQGAIEMVNSREISISNCQIKNPAKHGILLKDSKQIIINGCMITKDTDQSQVSSAAIHVDELTKGVLVSNNVFNLGSKKNIINRNNDKEIMFKGNLNMADIRND